MTYVLWQAGPGEQRRDVSVRGAADLGLPQELTILAAVSDQQDLRTQARSYIQLAVPGVGPSLAWVGVPGGGQRDGCFVHPATGKTWPWGELRPAVQHAIDFAKPV
ncbi:hypothetical protein [Kribbella sp. NPDC051620]|uniref:hypothetical protein n=1 Tax=Kribbella sp. NPDC051620 TaxID=3364120 RepID=UPI003789116B